MANWPIEWQLAAVLAVTAAACALPGTFLVLRRMSLVADAIGHTLLFGIVAAFFVVRDLDSPLLMGGAAATGLLTVLLVEWLQRRRIRADAAIGLVFPFLFALAVLLVSLGARNIHMDVDAVLVGQPELALFPRWQWGQWAITPLQVLLAAAILNAGFVFVFYKELKLTTFDPQWAITVGYPPRPMHYLLMGLVSLTAVAAFDAVGPVLVVGYFVAPPATALLLSVRLGRVLLLAVAIGAASSVLGTAAAARWNASAAGSVAATLGLLLGMAVLFSPQRGWLARLWYARRHRLMWEELMLLVHLYQHEGTPDEAEEAAVDRVHQHLEWLPERVARVVRRTVQRGWVTHDQNLLRLTAAGREQARQIYGPRPATGN